MFFLETFPIFIIFLPLCFSDLCEYNFSLSDLHQGIWHQIKSFIVGTFTIAIRNCPDLRIDENNIILLLFNRYNEGAVRIDLEFPQIVAKKTIILLPGWLCDTTNDLMPKLKNAYLQRYDANVIIVDWSKYALQEYTTSYCYCFKVAEVMGSFLCKIIFDLTIKVEDIHLVGHSMGAQISGLIGQETKKQCSKLLGRITGLDPAGPLYQTVSHLKKLDRYDAKFVDVIHTNAGLFGYFGTCGTVDFYPNCGVQQAGCVLGSSQNLLDNIIFKHSCNHLRSVDFMIESISSDKFISYLCPHCPLLCKSKRNFTSIMGENSILFRKNASYTLTTNPTYPFSKG